MSQTFFSVSFNPFRCKVIWKTRVLHIIFLIYWGFVTIQFIKSQLYLYIFCVRNQLIEEDTEFDQSDPSSSSRKNTMTSIASSSRSNSVSTTVTPSKDRAESVSAPVPPPMARTTSNAQEQQSRTASITSVKDRAHSEAQPPESEVGSLRA